tara:strand:+ start:3004 stop:3498 length:495 start_codon:yes stop_codon:yes gene_type:complete
MKNNRIEVSDSTAVSMPMKNLISIVMAVALGVWAYFGIIERINNLETKTTLAEKDLSQISESFNQDLTTVEERIKTDLEKNTEFRIKWPRGDMGSLPADSEQFMLIEFLSGQVEQLTLELQGMMNNKVNIERLQKDMQKALDDIEKLKDKIRANGSYTESKKGD